MARASAPKMDRASREERVTSRGREVAGIVLLGMSLFVGLSVGSLQLGDSVRVYVDGVTEPRTGTISYIAPRAEYTPPVVYSADNRNKFVFLVEAVFTPEVARELHPGQPVEVELSTALP